MRAVLDALFSPPVAAALLVGVAFRLLFLFFTPIAVASAAGRLSTYNDEPAHVRYVQHILLTNSLPLQVESIREEGAIERASFENYQPPLYYSLVVVGCRALNCRDTAAVTRVGRALSFLLSLALLAILLAVAVELELSPVQRAVTVMFWALSGVMVRFASVAGNDVLFWVWSGVMILCALRMERDTPHRRDIALFAAVAVLGLYTKLSTLLLLPLPFVALRRQSLRRWIGWNGVILAVVLLATLPLWHRNVTVFGSLVPLNAGFGAPTPHVPPVASLLYAVRSFVLPWHEFWRGGAGLALMSPLLLLLARSGVARPTAELCRRSLVLIAALGITVTAYLWLNTRYDQAEARYLFAAWPCLAILFANAVRTRAALWVLLTASLLPYALIVLPAAY